jgi:hypothetical protein
MSNRAANTAHDYCRRRRSYKSTITLHGTSTNHLATAVSRPMWFTVAYSSAVVPAIGRIAGPPAGAGRGTVQSRWRSRLRPTGAQGSPLARL